MKPRVATWSPTLQRAIGKTSQDRNTNTVIENCIMQIDDTTTRIYQKGYEMSIETFKLMHNRAENDYSTIGALFDYHEIMEKKKLEPGSFRGYVVTKKHMLDYIRIKYKVADYHISAIDKSFVFEFFAYLQGYRREGKIKCHTNGALKHITRFRRVMNLALQNEWIDRNPVCLLKVKKDKVEIGYLTEKELKELENTPLKPHLSIVRDIFLFSVYTGAAYVDMQNLKNKNLCMGIDKSIWLTYHRQKTNTRCPVPLLKPAEALIEKYKAYHDYDDNAHIFPIPSNQICNRYLKIIAKEAGIEKDLSFHMARHTFATTITLTAGIPIETVSKMLGHSSLTTTQIYAKVIDTKIMDDMAELKKAYEQINRNVEDKKYKVAQ